MKRLVGKAGMQGMWTHIARPEAEEDGRRRGLCGRLLRVTYELDISEGICFQCKAVQARHDARKGES